MKRKKFFHNENNLKRDKNGYRVVNKTLQKVKVPLQVNPCSTFKSEMVIN